MLKFGFTNETKARVGKKHFEDLTKKFYKVMKKLVDKKLFGRDGLVDMVVVDDETIAVMNEEYREKVGPTDVISFAYLEVTEYEKEEGDVIVGDIFISIDTIKRQAKEHKLTVQKEMDKMFVHGLLHCFGFDHQNDEEEAEMEGWARQVLGWG